MKTKLADINAFENMISYLEHRVNCDKTWDESKICSCGLVEAKASCKIYIHELSKESFQLETQISDKNRNIQALKGYIHDKQIDDYNIEEVDDNFF